MFYSWDTNIEYKVLMSLGEGLRDLMVTVESLKNKIIDKNNWNVDLNDWERILKRRVNIIGLELCKILTPWNSLDMV